MKKKAINMVLLFIFIGSLISLSANAAFGDIFRAGLNPIEDFFRGGWQNYEKTVSFLVFFFLFFSAYLIGMKKSMGELTRAHITFAFVAAFLSSFIITVSMRFDWINLKYIAWFLIAVLILFLMYSLLSKMFEKHKFLAFLLALLLTALLLWLIWYLMSEGRSLERFGRISDVFGRFGKEKIPKREPLGAGPPIGREEPGAAPEVKPPVTPEGKGWFGRNWWIVLILLIPALVGGGYGLKKGIDRWKGRRGVEGGPGGEKPPKSIEVEEKFLLDLLDKLIKIQELIMKGFKDKIKHGIILTKEESQGYNFPDPDIAWFYKEENIKTTNEISKEISKLVEYNKGLIEKLNEGLRLDVKEMGVLKYLAQELKNEEEAVLQAVNEYYEGKYYDRSSYYLSEIKKPKNQFDSTKPYAPLKREHYKKFDIKSELNEKIKTKIIIADKEMRKYFVQMLAPVLVRLYQLFWEFKKIIEKEHKEALSPLNDFVNGLPKEEGEEITKLDGNIKPELDAKTKKFVEIVKDDEWIIYKNLEKDHDDKEEAKNALKERVWERKEAKKKAEEEKLQKQSLKAEKEKKSVEGSKRIIIKLTRKASTGSEIDLIARGKGIDLSDPRYRLLWYIKDTERKGVEPMTMYKNGRKVEAIGNNIKGVIPSDFLLGKKALIGAAVYDPNGDVVAESKSVEIKII